jgi:hypothetical protein
MQKRQIGLLVQPELLERILEECVTNPIYMERPLSQSVLLMVKLFLDNKDKGNITYE